MSKNDFMMQNNEYKESDTSLKHTMHPYKPSFLKDPKTLFNAYSTDATSTLNLVSSINQQKAQDIVKQQVPAVPVAEDIFGVGFSGDENVSSDQQPTWLIPAVAHLRLIKEMPALPRQKDRYTLLIQQLMKDVGISTIISCLYAATLALLGKVPEQNRSKK